MNNLNSSDKLPVDDEETNDFFDNRAGTRLF